MSAFKRTFTLSLIATLICALLVALSMALAQGLPDQEIAFVSASAQDIYVLDTRVGFAANLTHRQGSNFSPIWSPDGQHLAFVSTRDRGRDLYVMNPDGSNLRHLADHVAVYSSSGRALVWSPDGSQLAFASATGNSSDISVVDYDGRNLRRLTHGSYNFAPAWSPDGSRIAFISNQGGTNQIYAMSATGQDVQQMTDGAQILVVPVELAWSPDGQRLAVIDLFPQHGIYVVDVREHRLRQVTDALTVNPNISVDPNLKWSPDSRQIAFNAGRFGGNSDVYLVDVDSGALHDLSNSPSFDALPQWLPDGRQLIFESNRSGIMSLYVLALDNLSVHLLFSNVQEPAWRP